MTLPNGLVTVVVPRQELQRAHLALYVRVGSRFEDKETNGLSHFLEHMLYRGTPRLPSAHQVNLAFERLGGFLYAATHTDFGVFSVTLPPESMDEASSHFGELLREPLFADIEIEKGIVCEEILEDLDDEGRQVDADNISRALIYPTHPLGFTITGDETRVRSFDDAMLRAHHARHYVAKSSVLVYSGPVDADEAMAMGARDFSWMPPGERILGGVPEHTQKKPRYKRVENSSSQTELRVCLRAPSEQSAERPVIEMLMRILDDGMSTRLYHRICDAGGLCYDVSAGYDGYEDDGIVDFAAGVLHERAPLVTREILAIARRAGRDGADRRGDGQGAATARLGHARHARFGRGAGRGVRRRLPVRSLRDGGRSSDGEPGRHRRSGARAGALDRAAGEPERGGGGAGRRRCGQAARGRRARLEGSRLSSCPTGWWART